MQQYNLTQRERQILVQLLTLSQRTKDRFEARIADPDAAAGPARELVAVRFGADGEALEVTRRDLRLLKDEGLIYFRWDAPDRGTGRLSTRAFDAVGSNFSGDDAHDAAGAAALAAAATDRAELADRDAIALRFAKITAELVVLVRELIDQDESQAADHEAASIAEELKKEQADETIITRKTKGFVSRLALTFSGTTDLAAKGERIGEFGERLAAWLVALSVWTEWHAAHHPPADPCV